MLRIGMVWLSIVGRIEGVRGKLIAPKLDTENWPNLRASRCPDCGKRVFVYVGEASGEFIFLDPDTGDRQTHMFRHVGKRCNPKRGALAAGRVRLLNALGKTG